MRKLPKSRPRHSLSVLQPSLAQIMNQEKEQDEKLAKQHRTALKNRKRCEDCALWAGDHCGIYSSACASSPKRPRFLPKEDLE